MGRIEGVIRSAVETVERMFPRGQYVESQDRLYLGHQESAELQR